MPTLPTGTHRRLLAERQLLGPAGRAGRGPVDVVAAIGPVHSTDPASAHLQIAARADVTVAAIDRALYVDRALLRHTTLRRTVHLLTPALARAAHGAYNHRLTPKLRRNLLGWITDAPEVDGPVEEWLTAVEEDVVAAVTARDRPSGAELAETVPGLRVQFEISPGKAYSRPSRITSRVLELLIAEGRIARDRPRGAGFTSGAWTYGPVTAWVPGGLPAGDPPAALTDLLRHRLHSFPALTTVDLAWWTGLPKGQITAALRTLAAVPVDRADGRTGWALPDDDLTPTGLGPAAALLPGLDATPMGAKERDWFLGPHGSALFDRSGNVGPTIWWDGRIVGGWTQRDDGRIVTRFLEAVGDEATTAVAAEAERLTGWLGEVRIRWRYPTPLQRELQGS